MPANIFISKWNEMKWNVRNYSLIVPNLQHYSNCFSIKVKRPPVQRKKKHKPNNTLYIVYIYLFTSFHLIWFGCAKILMSDLESSNFKMNYKFRIFFSNSFTWTNKTKWIYSYTYKPNLNGNWTTLEYPFFVENYIDAWRTL